MTHTFCASGAGKPNKRTQTRNQMKSGISYGVLAIVFVSLIGCSSSRDASDAAMTMGSPSGMTQGVTPTLFDAPQIERKYQDTITPHDLEALLYYFASDYFEGRETATRGQEMASLFLASQYMKMGLQPKGTGNDEHNVLSKYLQPFPVYAPTLTNSTLSVRRNGSALATSHFSPDFQDDKAYPLSTRGPAESTGPLLFIGYGIEDADLGYDDVAAVKELGVNIEDYWVMILRDEPLANADKSLLPTADGKPSNWTTNMNTKFRALFSAGMPKGIMVVSDVGPRADKTVRDAAIEQAEGLTEVSSLSLTKPDGSTPSRFRRPPMYAISADFANQLLIGTGESIEGLQADLNKSLKPKPFVVDGIEIQSKFETGSRELMSANVAAFVEGSDLKDEVVVLSSHYDHIGLNSGEGDIINNGADDDGSGTVTVLEIAEAFQKAKDDGHGPRRSILFLNVAGEEKGLLGSEYYADVEPLLPLDKTVTDLNIDMIGRHDPTHPDDNPDYVYIIGSKLISQELHDINARANQVAGTNLVLHERFNSKDDPNRFYARSDHWNFGKHSIPFIFFFTGTHEDYHRVGDEAYKIDYDRMARIGQMIFATAWQVANQDVPPAVSGTGFN